MKTSTSQAITEITPLSDKDFFYLIDRRKAFFDYPVHSHTDYELNFVAHAPGAHRVVGDSIEEIPEFDLVMVGNGIEHAWEQNRCTSANIHEITVQFSRDLFNDSFLAKTQMAPIREMLNQSHHGIVFSQLAVMRVFNRLERLTRMASDFYRVMEFFVILHELATTEGGYRVLSSSSFAKVPERTDSRRVQKVNDYITEHFREDIHLDQLARMVGMTPTAFSRFFKLRTGRTVSDLIIDIRLGYAARALVDTTHNISEICYECGFNNISYFNRVFKRRKGCSPKDFRDAYKRHRSLV